MPRKSKPKGNRHRRNRSNAVKGGRRAFATNIRTPVAPGNRYRTTLSDNVSSTGTVGSVSTLPLTLKGSRYSTLMAKASQLKINKVAITVLPQTYLEFVVRGTNTPNLDNRSELVNQPDAIKVFSPSKPKSYWFRPNQNIAKGWLDIQTSSEIFNSGLWVTYTGQNQLNATGSEMLFQIQFDVSFQGIDFLSS